MLHVALFEPEIPWNTGNVGRTCLAARTRLHLIRPFGFSLHEKRIRRAGLDYWTHVDPTVHASFAAFEAALPGLGAPFFFCADAGRDLYETEIPDDAVFVFGRESDGFPEKIRVRYRAAEVRLPIADARVRSLNLSTCVGIAVYEALRRRA
ncbi:MAG: tRNA (cytidine(34)-2'-O)-methyltransferase [Planctomycetota bacterium]|nr:tRNA (cytidine(34)-2'-O)-methyltransferase [Planctomycetota bacterium]